MSAKYLPTRSFTKVKGAAYSHFLPHDEEERQRLALQHNILLKAFNNKALYAPVQLTADDWVLDTGTGTGIWLEEIARQTSTAMPKYIGVDIESSLLPDPTSLPPHMSFEIHSVTDLPVEWADRFTIVHQRLLCGGLRQREWEQAIAELYRVLKPGGWIQLLEFRFWSAGPVLAKQLEMMYRHAQATGTLWRDIARRLPDLLERGGFINIHEETRRTPMGVWAGQDGIDGKRNLSGLMNGFKTPVLEGGGYGIVETDLQYDELMERVLEEIDNTVGAGTDWSLFWAQKPLEKEIVQSKL